MIFGLGAVANLRIKRPYSLFVRIVAPLTSIKGKLRSTASRNIKLLDIASNDAYIPVRRREMPTTVEARQDLGAIGPQTFADESDRARLSEVALKAFLALMKAWDLSNAEAAALLGVSSSTLDRMKRGYRPTLSQDQLTRVSALVGVYKGLHLLFADATADEWARRPNRGPLFDRETPIEAMIEGGIPRMLEVRRYIDAVRGGL
jgi:hypothetical protein